MLELANVGDIEVDAIGDIDAMGHWCRVAIGIKDALVEGVVEGACETRWFPAVQGVALLDLVKESLVLLHQCGVKEESLC